MPRMPMIAVAALLLLTSTATPAFARATERYPTTTDHRRPTTTTDASNEDVETSSSGRVQSNTVIIEVDTDIILTTEDGVEEFTQLPEFGQTTTEEPLPESVLRQLENERVEQEESNKPNITTTTTTTEANIGKGEKNLITTTRVPLTTPAKIASALKDNIKSYLDHSLKLLDNAEDLLMEEEKLDAAIETTTLFLGPEATTESIGKSEAKLVDDHTEMDVNANAPLLIDMEPLATDSVRMEETTWMPLLAELVDFTSDIRLENIETTTIQPDPEPAVTSRTTENSTTAAAATEKPIELHMFNSDAVAEKIMMQPETTTEESSTTSLPETTIIVQKDESIMNTSSTTAPETTTYSDSTTRPIPETTSATTERSELAAIPTTTTTATPETSTTRAVEELPETTVVAVKEQPHLAAMVMSTTTGLPETTTTLTSTISTTEALLETSIAATKEQSLLAAILIPNTTTVAPETTSTTSTTTTTTTTTEPLPATRAPRVERIFNSDGVEVLYGYSSVVRTNRA